MSRRHGLLLLLVVALSTLSAATISPVHSDAVAPRMPVLALQLGVVVLAARFGATLSRKLRLSDVLGELLAGIAIGPFLLGAIPLPGFPMGLFALPSGNFPVTPELYGFASVASIVLLFFAGLETDIGQLRRFSLPGLVIGASGIIVSFSLGLLTGSLVFGQGALDPRALFLGIIAASTSLGITVRVLSDNRRMDTPEAVTMLAGSVFDDVLGVILLSVGAGIAAAAQAGNNFAIPWDRVFGLIFRYLAIWLGLVASGLIFSRRIAHFLKWFPGRTTFSVLALGFALLLAGITEHLGLAMIIGAYIMGLSLSRTDINYTIMEKLRPLQAFFVPIFFTVMGMLLNLRSLLLPWEIVYGLLFLVVALAAKFFGCGVPALFLGFNRRGATRIGLGMMPRGELALIAASVGMSGGLIDDSVFGMMLVMVVGSIVIAPNTFAKALRRPGSGLRHAELLPAKQAMVFNVSSKELASLLRYQILQQFKAEGFYVYVPETDENSCYMRRDDIFVTMRREHNRFIFRTDRQNLFHTHHIVTEAAFFLQHNLSGLKELERQLPAARVDSSASLCFDLENLVPVDTIVPRLKSTKQEGVLEELVGAITRSGRLHRPKEALRMFLSREDYLSSGLVNGIAVPHIHTDEVDTPLIAVGISAEGIDFKAIDNAPSYIVFMMLTPESASETHLRMLSMVSRLTHSPKILESLRHSTNSEEMRAILLSALHGMTD